MFLFCQVAAPSAVNRHKTSLPPTGNLRQGGLPARRLDSPPGSNPGRPDNPSAVLESTAAFDRLKKSRKAPNRWSSLANGAESPSSVAGFNRSGPTVGRATDPAHPTAVIQGWQRVYVSWNGHGPSSREGASRGLQIPSPLPELGEFDGRHGVANLRGVSFQTRRA